MTNEETPIPPHAIAAISGSLEKLAEATKQQTVATLAAAIITASGKPWSIEQVLEVEHDIDFSIHPAPNYGTYKEWLKTKDARQKKVHK
jgi:hypothetical protein